MKRDLSDIIFHIVLGFALILIAILAIFGIKREIDADKKPVTITVTVSSVHYDPPHTTYQYNAGTKTMIPIHHPAKYKTYFNYENFVIDSTLEEVYDYASTRIGQQVKIEAIKVTYTDGEIVYRFNHLILN